jgi:acyl-lipid omega-6 desaturase (Delta-12 desaturase)
LDQSVSVVAPSLERDWISALHAYRASDIRQSIFEIIVTAGPFVMLWAATWAALQFSFWLSLLVAIPAGAFLVRLFLIQHDCGHGAMFKKKTSNDWVGRVLGVFTMTPYDVWRKQHSIHHATHGNLDKRGMGDIDLLTLQEYRAQPLLKRFLYRLYRHPIVMFGLGPSFVFFILYRYPSGLLNAGWIYWISAMGTNLGILAVGALMMWWLGWGAFLMVHIPIVIIAATIGIWLFYVQHQFEDAFWEEGENWSLQDAALYGSSFYDLPKPLQWLTANIGVHHVHHLYSKIPFYRLHKVMKDFPELAGFRRLTFMESLSCLKLRLWDEDSKRMVTLREAARTPV